MNRFVEHQMLTTFKEFRADCYRHFKKYSDPEEARANPPNILEQSRTNKAARQNGSKSFLQRQHELAEKKGELVDRMELFWEIHVRVGTFMSQAAKNAHVKSNAGTPVSTYSRGSQPLSGMRYAIRCWVDDQITQKALVGDPSRRPARQRVQAVSRHLVHRPHKNRLNYNLNLMKLWNGLKCKIEIT
uniref:CACTA en-spm transposon protein n=1 Tax=Cucumis melo TaxID=3656 RepID=A0A9I9EKX3_CUCME